MEIMKDRYTITELSKELGVTDHTLRYYQKEFSLPIPKDKRGRRYYTPETANIMYQIKRMRDEGLEIKAIRKILQSENVISDPPPVVMDEQTTSIVNAQTHTYVNPITSNKEVIEYFENLKEQITSSVTTEVVSAKDELTKELNRTKLELGACVENSVRKLERKLEKHFDEVDRSLGDWREKNKKKSVKKLLGKIIK